MALEPYRTTCLRDFPWPLVKPPCSRAVAPPEVTRLPGYYMQRPQEFMCPCDGHELQPLEERLRALSCKECNMLADLCGLRKEMTWLSNEILKHPCGSEEDKLKSLSMSAYTCKGIPGCTPVVAYKPLMAAVDSRVGVPIPPARRGLGKGHRDPLSFRVPPHVRPIVDPNDPVCFWRAPKYTQCSWLSPWPGLSEYGDCFSRMGVTLMRCQQQFREPNPTSRGRFGEPCA